MKAIRFIMFLCVLSLLTYTSLDMVKPLTRGTDK